MGDKLIDSSSAIARYKSFGDAGLIHRSRGKPSSRAYTTKKKEEVIALYQVIRL